MRRNYRQSTLLFLIRKILAATRNCVLSAGVPLLLCVAFLTFPISARAQWYTDPHNPTPVYQGTLTPGGMLPDLNGGLYVFAYGPSESVMLSHANIEGQWSCLFPGVVIGPPYSAWAHTEVLDPDNNVIVHGTNVHPYLPATPSLLGKWSITGDPVWSPLSFPDTLTRPHSMVSDELGGSIILISITEGEQLNWFIQHFDSSGQPQFGWTERPLLGPDNYYIAQMISDGAGGGFVFWTVEHDTVYKVQMQHIRSNGSFAFADSGITLAESSHSSFGIESSSVWSFYLFWTSSQLEYHCTRFDSSGTIIWDSQGFGWNYEYVFSDRLGGLYFFQNDSTYARINALGELVFSGQSLSPWSFYSFHKTISPIGELSVLHWDEVNEVWTLQKYDTLGNQMWLQAVPVLYGMPSIPSEYMVSDTQGGVILVFQRSSGTYFTRVDAYGQVGSSLYARPVLPVPSKFEIEAYPNPFNNRINIVWTTNMGGTLWLSITDILGRRVLSLGLAANTTRYIWDGRDAWGTPVPSGVYYATLWTGRMNQSMQIVLIK